MCMNNGHYKVAEGLKQLKTWLILFPPNRWVIPFVHCIYLGNKDVLLRKCPELCCTFLQMQG